jgi:hypothetical protein
MDGTGTLFAEFIRLLPRGVEAQVVSYPQQEFLTYAQLAERVTHMLPHGQPYIIVAESYSGCFDRPGRFGSFVG